MSKSLKYCYQIFFVVSLRYWSFSDMIFDKCKLSDGITDFCFPPPPLAAKWNLFGDAPSVCFFYSRRMCCSCSDWTPPKGTTDDRRFESRNLWSRCKICPSTWKCILIQKNGIDFQIVQCSEILKVQNLFHLEVSSRVPNTRGIFIDEDGSNFWKLINGGLYERGMKS